MANLGVLFVYLLSCLTISSEVRIYKRKQEKKKPFSFFLFYLVAFLIEFFFSWSSSFFLFFFYKFSPLLYNGHDQMYRILILHLGPNLLPLPAGLLPVSAVDDDGLPTSNLRRLLSLLASRFLMNKIAVNRHNALQVRSLQLWLDSYGFLIAYILKGLKYDLSVVMESFWAQNQVDLIAIKVTNFEILKFVC